MCLIAKNTAYDTTNTQRERDADAERLRAQLAEAAACTRARRSPTPLSSASRGDVNRPQESVPQMPARPCADSAPTGSSSTFSIRITPYTTITPATAPMIGAAQNST